MADLASKRNARDLWISKGHVGAVAVLCFALVVGAYAIGFAMGQASGTGESREASTPVGNATVVELLDRIEGSTMNPADQRTLTFPDVLSGAETAVSSSESQQRPKEVDITKVLPGKVTGPVIRVRDIRRGELALQMALKQMGKGKLVGRTVGPDAQHVTIAGFSSLEETQQYLEDLKQQYADLDAVFEIGSQ